MGQINSANLPQYAPEPLSTRSKSNTANPVGASPSESFAPQDDLQITRLSNVLSGIKKSASSVRSQVAQLMSAVRSGTYQVDALEVSKSIVGDALAIH